MRKIVSSCMFFLFLCAPCFGAEAANVWGGKYLYEYYGGRTAGGSPISINYQLTVEYKSGKYSAALTEQGYQIDETIMCDSVIENDKITFTFRSYGNGKITNEYGISIYRVGEPLFYLEKLKTASGEKIITHWLSLADELKKKKPGVYFKKLK